MKYNRVLLFCIPVLWMGLFFLPVRCAVPDGEKQLNTNPGFFSSLYSDKPLDAVLTFDLDSVIAYMESEEEIDGTLRVDLATPLTVSVEIRSRGITRKKICAFPPLRIQLKKAAIAEHKWGEFRSYKLVTHCSDSLASHELLLREYLVYKLYEKLTHHSFRAQLLDLEYVLPRDTLQRFAILIENETEMEHRLGLQALDVQASGLKSIHMESYKRFVLFQYMIGNTDWNLSTSHNTRFVLEANSSSPIAIPYDFDYCGLVNAPYARPYETMPIAHVRDRHFMYRGKKEDDFNSAVQDFMDRKDEWFEMIETFPHLSNESKQDVRAYLEEFFQILERPDWKETVFSM